jgi:hypothetical protein
VIQNNDYGNNPTKWGQRQRVMPADVARVGAVVDLVMRDQFDFGARFPLVQTLLLTYRAPKDIGGAFIPRFVLSIGNGGATEQLVIDAKTAQHVTLACEQVRVTFRVDQLGPVAYSAPDKPMEIGVFLVDGQAPGDGATYTEFFEVLPTEEQTFQPPKGASAFRIAGDAANAANDIYDALTAYTVESPSGDIIDSFTGAFLGAIRYAPMPFNAAGSLLRIDNNAALRAAGALEWELSF